MQMMSMIRLDCMEYFIQNTIHVRKIPYVHLRQYMNGIFFNYFLLTEIYGELNQAFVWFVMLLSFIGLYMYKALMTTEAGTLLV